MSVPGAPAPAPARPVAGALGVGLAAWLAACGPPPPSVGPGPAEGTEPSSIEATEEESREPAPAAGGPGVAEARERSLPRGVRPPIPRRIGPLALRVQYPERNQRITVRDSNFLFGSVGTGDAELEIDGQRVPVEPNGAFLTFLPVPETRGDTALYRLVARRPGEVDTLLHPVLPPPLPYVGIPGSIWLDTAAMRDPPERWALPDERLPIAVRGAPGLRVWLEIGGDRFPLEEGLDPAVERWQLGGPSDARAAPSRLYTGRIRAIRLARAAGRGTDAESDPGEAGSLWSSSTPDTLELAILAQGKDEMLRLRRRLPLRVLDPETLPVVSLHEAADPENGQSGVVVGRPGPFGPYRWLFPSGALGLVEGRIADRLKLRLAPLESAWVLAEDVEWRRESAAELKGRVGDARVEPRTDRLILHVRLQIPLPIQVDQPDERTILLTLYGAQGETNRIAYGERDPLLESVRWEQTSEGVYRIILRLSAPVWGYRASYGAADPAADGEPRGEAAGKEERVLRLEIRRPPSIDPERPLRGRRIAVDPGHPGGGAHGPTGLYEGDANLAIARRLVAMLRAEGAEPILIRTDTARLGLYQRTARAIAADAELFVSIHNNALPDGVRPFGREGTSTYYYHPHSRELAAALQAGMLEGMGLRDLGILWGDLAVTRMSWMPSVLAEGAFIMMPLHEEWLRRPQFQAGYARGVLWGIRDFLAARASARPTAR